MGAQPRQELTAILGRARAGDERAKGELIALVYDELRRVASGLMRRERADHTLSPTAVVHEAVIRLLGDAVFDKAADRSYLFASAGTGHAAGPRRPREAEGRRPARRRPAAHPTGLRPGLLRRSRNWTSSPSTRPSTGWPSGTSVRRRS